MESEVFFSVSCGVSCGLCWGHFGVLLKFVGVKVVGYVADVLFSCFDVDQLTPARSIAYALCGESIQKLLFA